MFDVYEKDACGLTYTARLPVCMAKKETSLNTKRLALDPILKTSFATIHVTRGYILVGSYRWRGRQKTYRSIVLLLLGAFM